MRTRHGYLVASVFSLGLAVAVLGYAAGGRFDDRSYFVILLLLFSLICLLPIVSRLLARKFDPFEPPIFVGMIYFLGFGLLSVPLLDPSAQLHRFLEGEFHWHNLALLYLSVGLLLLWLGYRSPIPVWLESMLSLNRQPSVRGSRQRLSFWWIIVLYALGVSAKVYLVASGTYGFLLVQHWDVYDAQLPFLHWLTQLSLFSSYALVLAAIGWFAQRGIRERVVFYWFLVGELLFAFIGGHRSHVLHIFIYISVAYFYLHRRMSFRWISISVVVLIFSFPLTEIYRKALMSSDRITGDQVLGLAHTVITEAVTDGSLMELFGQGAELAFARLSYIDDFASAVKFTDMYGYYPRRYEVLLLPALTLIPRAIWSDKPRLELGYWFSTEVLGGTTRSSNATTLPGSFYLFFGLWGYLVAMLLMGVLQAFVYRRYGKAPSLSALFFAPFLVVAMGNPEQDFFSLSGLIQQLIIMAVIKQIVFIEPGGAELGRLFKRIRSVKGSAPLHRSF